jgi:NhaA family Na+:H+ antiporter
MAAGTGDHDTSMPSLPREPIDRLVGPLARFLHIEAASGVVLLLCTVVALTLANSSLAGGFLGIWKAEFGFKVGSFEMIHSLKHWINDGLMAVFFFVVGLEVKRELVLGELREIRRAALPFAAAIGGMVVPAGLYLVLQSGQVGARGWGIPMATDIAFVVGCLALLGPRVPRILRVVLLSLAIVDDIGAILVIAIGYTENLDLAALGYGVAGLGLVFAMSRLGIRSYGVYVVVGFLIWLAFHESGVHATIAGVALGLLTPARSWVSESRYGEFLDRFYGMLKGDGWEGQPHRAAKVRAMVKASRETVAPLEYLENRLHPWVGFAIMPVFALANAGVAFSFADFGSPVAVAVMLGLVIGKPVGVLLFAWIVVRLFLRRLPDGLGWGAILGGGCLAGIGFTMALFIAGLALGGDVLDEAKVGILGGSAISAVLGAAILIAVLPKPDGPSANA